MSQFAGHGNIDSTISGTENLNVTETIREDQRPAVVIFGQYSGNAIKMDGEELIIMSESEIFGVIA